MNDNLQRIIDLQFYKGQNQYSDGDIEDEILKIVGEQSDFTNVLSNDQRWPILYHLSPIRRNLLEWYPFDHSASVLEIGAGCGALTGLLCEKVEQVTANELSKRRAEIIATRHQHHSNLKVIVGNLNDIKVENQFDYITLIGVLEYAGKFTSSSSPYLDFLRNVSTFLKPGGKLLVAIENRYGLKYWNGAREDHTGKYFDGLENYMASASEGVRTFSKDELSSVLMGANFNINAFYYPYPDYKLPQYIFSDDFSISPGIAAQFEHAQYDQSGYSLFKEEFVWYGLIKNHQFGFFANSFLVECEKREGEA